MSLLDSDSEKIAKSEDSAKNGTGRKAGLSGLNRFKSLNRFGSLTEQYREKKTDSNSNEIANQKKSEIEAKKDLLRKEAEKAKQTRNHVETDQSEQVPPKKQTSEASERVESIQPIVADPVQNKQNSIATQTEFKLSQQTVSNEVQTESKQISKRVHREFKQTPQQSSKQPVIAGPIELAQVSLGTLNGLQKRMLDLCFILAKQKGSRVVGPITRDSLGHHLQIHKENVKTVIYRLCNKGYLTRLGSKEGRGGFLQLEIPEHIYYQLSQEEVAGRLIQTGEALIAKVSSEQSPQLSSSAPSSSLINTTREIKTTTRQPLEGEWADVQIPLAIKDKLSASIIFQCRDRNLIPPRDLQKSIDAFAFDIVENKILEKKAVLSPQGFFMAAIQNHGGYTKPSNFLSDEDRAEQEMLNRLEAQAREREERKLKLFELSFQEWKATAYLADILKEAPEYVRGKPGPILDAHLKEYFERNVFKKQNTSVDTNSESERKQISLEIEKSLGSVLV